MLDGVDVPTTSTILSFAGLSIITLVVTEVIIRAWKPSDETKGRFGPLLSIAVALVFAGLGALATVGANLLDAVLLAIMVGFSTSGIYDTIKGLYGNGGS
jgi:hypothetical protein